MKNLQQNGSRFVKRYFEACVWITAIVVLAFAPVAADGHIIICPFRLVGFHFCPGCGLGTSISLLLHGRLADSVSMHPMAIPALMVLSERIMAIIRNENNFSKINYNLTQTDNNQKYLNHEHNTLSVNA